MPSESLTAAHHLEFPGGYTRSVGPVLSRFLTGLRDGELVGVKTAAGRVLCPPSEYDPDTAAATTDDYVTVGPAGTVTTWAWVHEPKRKHPLDHPFAWALIRFDGADTAMLHAVDAGDESAMHTGARVVPRWKADRVGHVADIEAFVLGEDATPAPARSDDVDTSEPVTSMAAPIALDYELGAGTAASKFLRGVKAGKLLGQRCPICEQVYIPPRGSCAVHGVPTEEEVECGPEGTLTTYCVVNLQFHPAAPPPPYVCAQVLLDNANTPFFGLIDGTGPTGERLTPDDIRMGMRVRAVWKDPSEWGLTVENVSYFEPTGDPDADFETYKDYQ